MDLRHQSPPPKRIWSRVRERGRVARRGPERGEEGLRKARISPMSVEEENG